MLRIVFCLLVNSWTRRVWTNKKKLFRGRKKQFRPKCCVWTSVIFLPRKCEGWNYKVNRVLPDSSISRGLAFFVACCGVPCHVEV